MRTGFVERGGAVFVRVMRGTTEGEISQVMERHSCERDYGREAEMETDNFGDPRYILVPVRSTSVD